MSNFDKTILTTWSPDDIPISAALFNAAISLLNDLDIQDYDADIVQLYGYVLHSFYKIKASLDFKDAFARFFYTQEGHASFSSHMNSELFSNANESF